MTATVPYDVLTTVQGIERRRYPRHVTVDIRVTASAGDAGNRAFRPLAAYIGGKNRSSETLSMTAPVLQEGGERLAMTAPVIQERDDEAWIVSFVLPGSRPLAEYPVPLDDRIQLREVAEHHAAAVRWTGRWTESGVRSHTDELMQVMEELHWSAIGSPIWARYDPPWKPFFLRRNEIIIRIDETNAAKTEALAGGESD